MAKTFEQSLDDIVRLVKHYRTNRAACHAPGYKEAHARQNLIDPLFIALDWDVYNTGHAAPQYQPVVLEDSLDTESGKKAPDYAFRIGRDPVFFAEAKKPSVSIKTDPDPAYQLRRYAWSAKLPLSILTDFEELAVYDCRARPSDKDKVSAGRIDYFTFEEYPDRWREVWDVFSYDAVRSGSFDAYAQSAKGKRGTSEVDAEFLKEIERWRDVLARNIALRNPRLSIDELNDAVQRTIDRIIFLRMAEDRGIEPYGRLLALTPGPSPVGKASTGEGSVYTGLIDLCRAADARYNAGLFDFSPKGDALAPKLKVDDAALKPILAGLYYPQSPYEFSVLPAEILGSVYEQFLGKVIRLTPSHHAKVEEKPEVKKAGGVYYTPAYIVEYIVKNTVGKLVEGKSPKQLEGFRVLDMACGSGSFLLGAYQYLLDYYLKWYVEHNPEKHPKAVWQPPLSSPPPSEGDRGGEWRLTTAEKKRILTAHIFGVDIDRQAAEVTKLSLLLKVLEGESDETLGRQLALFPERALPNLDANVKCGNSLIGPDYFAGRLMPDTEELRRVNPFDWEREFPEVFHREGAKDAKRGFDCVIGNPPYIRIHNLVDYYPGEVRFIQQAYHAAKFGKVDIYVAFIEKALGLIRESGRVGFIAPNKFMQADYGIGLRELLSKQQALVELVDFGASQVFERATTYTCLLFLAGSPQKEVLVRFKQSYSSPAQFLDEMKSEVRPIDAFGASSWKAASSDETGVLQKLEKTRTRLSDVVELSITGVKTGANSIFVFELLKAGKNLARLRPEDTEIEVQLETEYLRPYLKAESLKRYHISDGTRVLLYPYRLEGDQTRLVPESELKSAQPKTWQYLNEHKRTLENRQKGKLKGPNWYGLSFSSSLRMFSADKIVTPTLAPQNSFSIDTAGKLFPQGAGGGCGLVPKKGQSAYYLVGFLNSRLLTFFFQRISSRFQGGWYAYEPRYLNRIPIRPINFSDPADKARHDRMVALVEQMLELHKRLAGASAAGREVLQRQIDATDGQIDQLVYELYGLTEDEIRIVEGD